MQTSSTPGGARARRPSWPDPQRCTVEVLVVSGCPGTSHCVSRIREAAEELGLETNLRFLIIDNEEQAIAVGFKGSPTIRVEGVDVDADADERPVSLSCRLYPGGGATSNENDSAPPLAWIRAALAKAAPLLGLSSV